MAAALDEQAVRRLARLAGLRIAEVRLLVELEVVSPSAEAHPVVLRRLRRVRRLRRDLGLSIDAVVIIVRLLDRIDVLEGRSARTGEARVLDE